jgi:hypothetical protein
MPDSPPFGLGPKAKPQQVAAAMAADLDKASETAEDLASDVKSIFPNDAVTVLPARQAYEKARGEYNEISTFLIALMLQQQKPPSTSLDLTDAKQALDEFQSVANGLIATKQKPAYTASILGFSLSDITKVFDSIFGAIKWFVGRKDDERKAYADLLKTFQIRTWDEAGTKRPDPPASSTKPGTSGNDKQGGGNGSKQTSRKKTGGKKGSPGSK